MKTLQSRIAGAALTLALGLTFLLSATPGQAAANPDAVGEAAATVIRVGGRATVFKAGKAERITVGMKIGKGDKISTGLGQVRLDLGVHGDVTVDSRSNVTVDELTRKSGSEDGTTVFNLTKGGLIGNVKKVSSNSKYEVKTAKGVAGIRGTQYHILAVGVFKCANGQLQITLFGTGPNNQPKVFVVRAGSKLDATKVIEKTTNLTKAEASKIVDGLVTGKVEKIVNPPSRPTEVFISPVGGDNNRLFQRVGEGEINP